MTQSSNKPISLKAFFFCGLAAFFYLYEFALQVSPSVMAYQLMSSFQVNAAGLGFISGLYYYTYTVFQIPAGTTIDKYGASRVITAAVILCAFGTLIFALADSMWLAGLGRLLMGAGSAFAFVGTLVLITHWFPPTYFALMAGLTQSLSSAGAVLGTTPLAAAVLIIGWRHTMLYVALLGCGLAAVIFFYLQDTPVHRRLPVTRPGQANHFLQQLRTTLQHRQNIWAALYGFTIWAPATVFAALWGVPFLEAKYAITTSQASMACDLIWLGIER